MREFRLTQISDTHLARRLPMLTENFHRTLEHIDATRPDLVINTGDLAFDAPTNRDDLDFAHAQHAALPVDWRCIPGNHDIGDNPVAVGPPPEQRATDPSRAAFLALFGEDHWSFEAAGWCFIGLNTLIMNTGLVSEAAQFDWLEAQLSRAGNRPVALFVHKPLFLNVPDDPELVETAIRFVPQPARARLIEMSEAVDLRLVACGHVHQRRDFTYQYVRHVWAPPTSFLIPDERQEPIGLKETGVVEYRFRPDSFEVRHVRPKGVVDISLNAVLAATKTG